MAVYISDENGKLRKFAGKGLKGKDGKDGIVNIVDTLESTSIIDALSANQGKILNTKINELKEELNNIDFSNINIDVTDKVDKQSVIETELGNTYNTINTEQLAFDELYGINISSSTGEKTALDALWGSDLPSIVATDLITLPYGRLTVSANLDNSTDETTGVLMLDQMDSSEGVHYYQVETMAGDDNYAYFIDAKGPTGISTQIINHSSEKPFSAFFSMVDDGINLSYAVDEIGNTLTISDKIYYNDSEILTKNSIFEELNLSTTLPVYETADCNYTLEDVDLSGAEDAFDPDEYEEIVEGFRNRYYLDDDGWYKPMLNSNPTIGGYLTQLTFNFLEKADLKITYKHVSESNTAPETIFLNIDTTYYQAMLNPDNTFKIGGSNGSQLISSAGTITYEDIEPGSHFIVIGFIVDDTETNTDEFWFKIESPTGFKTDIPTGEFETFVGKLEINDNAKLTYNDLEIATVDMLNNSSSGFDGGRFNSLVKITGKENLEKVSSNLYNNYFDNAEYIGFASLISTENDFETVEDVYAKGFKDSPEGVASLFQHTINDSGQPIAYLAQKGTAVNNNETFIYSNDTYFGVGAGIAAGGNIASNFTATNETKSYSSTLHVGTGLLDIGYSFKLDNEETSVSLNSIFGLSTTLSHKHINDNLALNFSVVNNSISLESKNETAGIATALCIKDEKLYWAKYNDKKRWVYSELATVDNIPDTVTLPKVIDISMYGE